MFTITIAAGNSGSVTLTFKGEATAQAAANAYEAASPMTSVSLEDDFGQRVLVMKPVAIFLFADLKQVREAQVLQAVHAAETQAMAQARAMESPVLKQNMHRQGPAIMSPFPIRPS